VLGGGSAGFMAALALKTRVPAASVRILRSPELGIIGVGEGSTAALTDFLHQYLRVPSKTFHELAAPTWKLGLKFLHWGPREYFNYSFGPGLEIRSVPEQRKPNGFYCDENIEYPDPYSALMTHDRVFPRVNGRMSPHQFFAYHFENEKYVRFLEHAARAAGVEIIDATVVTVAPGERGIEHLVLASGEMASADLYVDWSGFSSMLLGRSLSEPFLSFGSTLFCERAIVGGWDRTIAEDQVIRPYTTCETMNCGWSWQIEHEHRIHRGYVYSPAFISDEDAERELRARNPQIGPTRIVKFVSGRYQRGWRGNVVAIGNASGFVEPLEATALGMIAQQSRLLADSLAESDRQPTPATIALFNRFHALSWDAIRRFLAVHYKYNTGLNTPFWQHCRQATDLAGAEEIVAYYAENGPSGFWGPTLLNNPHDQFTFSGYATLLTGMRVPYRKTWEGALPDEAAFEQRRTLYKQVALQGFTVREALAAIRSPQWKWN
jgi:tryptophan halogenase